MNTKIYSYLETSGGQSSNLYLNCVQRWLTKKTANNINTKTRQIRLINWNDKIRPIILGQQIKLKKADRKYQQKRSTNKTDHVPDLKMIDSKGCAVLHSIVLMSVI